MKNGMIWKIVALSAAVSGLAQMAGRAADLDALARDDYAHAIRPGGVDGSPFWNKYARMFMYPPAFDFSKGGPGTVKYRFTVLDAAGKTHVFDAPSSQSPLTPVWNDVATGQAWVYVSAVDKDGKVHGIPDWPRDRFSRSFWRSAPFRPGSYPSAPRSYAEAVAKCGDEIFERPATQHFLKTGKPDPNYTHNCYPAKMHSALIQGMLDYASRRPDRAEDALKLARIAADFLISISQPKGAPLEYWPPTYADRREAGATRYGQNMLIYPCNVGAAYLALYDRVKDAKYLDAAKRIADTYVKLQEADGTWPILIRESDGKVMNENRVQPTGVITFLERLYRTCGDEKYRACGDRAFAWIEANPLKDWFWEGQFEDAPLCAKYENPSKHPACELALYLLERFPGDRARLAVARDIVRYAEDQFVCWEKPCAANGHGINTSIADPSAQLNRYDDWFYPCTLEQYVYYVPVDASNAKMIRTYLALYRAEKNPLDLAKARALGDSLVRIQRPNGYIPTEYAQPAKRDDSAKGWLNCSCATLSALAELAAFSAQSAPKNGVVPMNHNRDEVLKFFEENVYGARPKFDGFVPKAEVVKVDRIAEAGAVRKTVMINTMTPIGEKTFKATAYFPDGKGAVPVFVMPGFRQPIREFDLAWKGKLPRWPVNDILARGCGTVSFDYNDVLKDDPHVLDGIERAPNAWGAISAWALAASRVADWLETEPNADKTRLAVVGLSRLGKTALWVGATDTRFAMVCPTCSGLFGARMATRNLGGETIDQITSKFPHWFAPQCRTKWCGKDWELPFDQHWLLGAVAPRLLAVGSAEDDWWACPSAEFCSWECSRDAFQRLKCKDNTSYHVRHGGHELTPEDWREYLDFAEKHGWMAR